MRRRLLGGLVAALVLAPVAASAQQSTGTIEGRIAGKATGRRVELVDVRTRAVIERARVGAGGAFVLRDVPYGTYDVEVLAGGRAGVARVTVSTAVPKWVTVSLGHYRAPAVTVAGPPAPPPTGSRTTYTAADVARMPASTGGKEIERLLLQTPGFVADEDGRLHVRGEDAQIQYVIDGIPITGNLTRVYAPLLSTSLIKKMDVETGSLDARYGVATAGVVAVTTRSGFDAPRFGRAKVSYGGFDAKDASLDLGGSLGSKAGLYLHFDGMDTGRYLDPVTGASPIHDAGRSLGGFGKLDAALSDRAVIEVLGGYAQTTYQVPNLSGASHQDQVQHLHDDVVGARLTFTASPDTVVTLTGYRREEAAVYTSSGLQRLTLAGYAGAVAANDGMFIGADRQDATNAGRLELETGGRWLGLAHTVKAGVAAEVLPIHERFSFAFTSAAAANPDGGGDSPLSAYDISSGGHPFFLDTSRELTRGSVYLEDHATRGTVAVDAGLRFDALGLVTAETGFSPRLDVTWAATPGLRLHVSYDRIVMAPPLENLLVSSAPSTRALSGADQGTTPTTVRAEREHVFEVGGSLRVGRHLAFDVTGYGKLATDLLVEAELGSSGIIFPVNLKRGVIAGVEARARLTRWRGFEATLSVSSILSRGLRPKDGTSPVAAGLILGDSGQHYAQPFGDEASFPTEHDEPLAAALDVAWQSHFGLVLDVQGRFDSGLPFDLVGASGKGLTAAQSRAYLASEGYPPSVIDLLSLSQDSPGSPDKSVAPHAVFDLMVGYDLGHLLPVDARLTVSVLNLFDTPFLYRFESALGGTHYGYPRMVNVSLSARY